MSGSSGTGRSGTWEVEGALSHACRRHKEETLEGVQSEHTNALDLEVACKEFSGCI